MSLLVKKALQNVKLILRNKFKVGNLKCMIMEIFKPCFVRVQASNANTKYRIPENRSRLIIVKIEL